MAKDKQLRTVQQKFMVTPLERQLLRELAAASKCTMAAYIRDALVQRLQKDMECKAYDKKD